MLTELFLRPASTLSTACARPPPPARHSSSLLQHTLTACACQPPLLTGMSISVPVCVRAARARQLAAALTKAGFKPKDKLGIYSGGCLPSEAARLLCKGGSASSASKGRRPSAPLTAPPSPTDWCCYFAYPFNQLAANSVEWMLAIHPAHPAALPI